MSAALFIFAFFSVQSAVAFDPPVEVFHFGEASYQVPFYPDASQDKMLQAGIKIYEGLTDAEKEQFRVLREQNIVARGWFLTSEFFSRFTKPQPQTTSEWWKNQQILSETGVFRAASLPHPLIQKIIDADLKGENKKLWRNPRLSLGQGLAGITFAIGHVLNFGAYKYSRFRTHMVGVTCFRDPARGLVCTFFYDREKGDDREAVKFSLEGGLTFRLQWTRTDGIARSEVDGVHVTAMGPGAFGSTTGSVTRGWSSTLSYFEVIPGYLATLTNDAATKSALVAFGGWMWWVQNLAIVPTVVHQYHTRQIELNELDGVLSAWKKRITEGAKNICSRIVG